MDPQSTPALVGLGQAGELQPVGSGMQGLHWISRAPASVGLDVLPGEAFGCAR